MQLHKNLYHSLSKTIILGFIVMLLSCKNNKISKNNLQLSAIAKNSIKIFTQGSDFDNEIVSELKQKGIKNIVLFDGRYIDPDNDFVVNEDILINAVESQILKTDKGPAVLDWEGDAFFILATAPESSEKYQKVYSQYLKALNICKKLRPNMQWGYYALPLTDYWLYDTAALQSNNKKLHSLMKQSDELFPSLYSYYPDGTEFTHNDLYIQYNINEILKIKNEINKKVNLFVWSRWHESNKEYGLKTIPQKEFASTLDKILKVNVNDISIDGLILFSADTFFETLNPALLKEERGRVNKIKHYKSLTLQNVSLIDSLLNN